MPTPRYPKGTMTTEHTVWCGALSLNTHEPGTAPWQVTVATGMRDASGLLVECLQYVQESSETVSVMKKIAKRRGWRLTYKYGWLCPHCFANRPKEEDDDAEVAAVD